MSLARTMKIKLLKACSVYGVPHQVGEVVEIDANNAANLVRKGWVEIVAEIESVPVVAEVESVTIARPQTQTKKPSKKSKYE
jgi:hypothetical protein